MKIVDKKENTNQPNDLKPVAVTVAVRTWTPALGTPRRSLGGEIRDYSNRREKNSSVRNVEVVRVKYASNFPRKVPRPNQGDQRVDNNVPRDVEHKYYVL